MTKLGEWRKNLDNLFSEQISNLACINEKQFNWLQSLSSQIDQWQSPVIAPEAQVLRSREVETAEIKSSEPEEPIPLREFCTMDSASQPESALSTCEFIASSPGVRFVADESLLRNSSDSGLECGDEAEDSSSAVPFTVAGSMRELTQSASSFRERWHEMLRVKKAEPKVSMKPVALTFDDNEDEIMSGYQISDDSDHGDCYDEIYERNPVEIHGKMIPFWARGDQLLKQLRRQKRIDPDSVFSGFTPDCPLPEIFSDQKPRWENRNDSGWWDGNRVGGDSGDDRKELVG
jgi:hypothetical protein